MTIAAFVPNLLDRSRFDDQVTFVDSPSEVEILAPSLVIVDLDRCSDIEGFRVSGSATVMGFGPHVDTDLHREATVHGYDEVLARSLFFKRLPELLSSWSES